MEEKRKKKEKIEKQMAESGPPPAGGLRVSIKIYLRFIYLEFLKTSVAVYSIISSCNELSGIFELI